MDLFPVSIEDKEKIRQHYNITEFQIAEYIEIIKIWNTKQPHLPQNLTDDFIEKKLLRNKFRIEQTKQKLDNYFKIRGDNRDILKDLHTIVPSKETTTFIPIPKLTPNFERINISKLMDFDPNRYDLYDALRLNLTIGELALRYDYAVGDRFLFDLDGFTLKHLTKINPIYLFKMVIFFEQAYSCRIVGIEVINSPPFISKILAIVKSVLSPKIYEKLKFHDDLESLHQSIPKQCLPEEYGGTLSSIPDLLKKLDEITKEHHDFFLECYNNVSQEHLRVPETKENDAFGVDEIELSHIKMDSLLVTENEKNQIRAHYNINESQIKEEIGLIKTWVGKQSHLPQNIKDDFIERKLSKNKFNVERTKQKLENYCTLRGTYKVLVQDFENLVPSKCATTFLPMPKLTSKFERIYIYRIQNQDFYDMYEFSRLALAVEELTLKYDYSVAIRVLCDLNNLEMRHLPKTDPIPVSKFMILLERAYSTRVRGFEFINFPPFVDKLMAIIKMALPAELFEKARLHENMESVYQLIPKENLPVEYGGSAGNMDDILRKWDGIFENHRTFFLECYKNISREDLRAPQIGNNVNDINFRELELD